MDFNVVEVRVFKLKPMTASVIGLVNLIKEYSDIPLGQAYIAAKSLHEGNTIIFDALPDRLVRIKEVFRSHNLNAEIMLQVINE